VLQRRCCDTPQLKGGQLRHLLQQRAVRKPTSRRSIAAAGVAPGELLQVGQCCQCFSIQVYKPLKSCVLSLKDDAVCCCCCLSPGLADQRAVEALSQAHIAKNLCDDVGGSMRQIKANSIFHAILLAML